MAASSSTGRAEGPQDPGSTRQRSAVPAPWAGSVGRLPLGAWPRPGEPQATRRGREQVLTHSVRVQPWDTSRAGPLPAGPQTTPDRGKATPDSGPAGPVGEAKLCHTTKAGVIRLTGQTATSSARSFTD